MLQLGLIFLLVKVSMNNSQIFFQVFIYLASAVIAVPIAKRLGFGSVLGYLLAGIIIGPFVFKLVSLHTENVMHFAEFGIVMMLFLIGMELHPSMLWEIRKELLLIGGLQLVITTVVIAIIGKLCGLNLVAAFALGLIFTSSSTALVLQMLHEKGWINLDAGNTIFSVLLFQDIAVIPMLAIFPILGSKSSANFHFGIANIEKIVLVILVLILIIGGSKYLLRPIFRFIASSKLNEAFTALALLLVIGITLIMNYVGLSPALGACLAGIILAESEYRHELEADIEPFKGLLLGLFFISIGTNIDFNLISHHLLFIMGLVIALILIKFLVLFLLGRIFIKNKADNWLIALTLAQGGEFCFILLSYASQNQIFTTNFAHELVAVVALSMLLTPIIMLLYDKVILPSLLDNNGTESDLISQQNPVVIAGFGRFGQIVSRYLLNCGIPSTILDIDVNQVDTIRKFGYKVFYGDAARLDLLKIAGIHQAKLFILAIDDGQKAIKIAVAVRKLYPELKILIRAHGRTDAYESLKQGFSTEDIYRETFDSALHTATDAFRYLGATLEESIKAADLFKQMDEEQVRRNYQHYNGKINDDFIRQAQFNSEDLKNILDYDIKSSQK